MSSNILSAPVTEFAFITLKDGKESERSDLEGLVGELQKAISTSKGFHGMSWGQSVDPGKENVYILVLGWDTAEVECFSSRRNFILTILAGSLGGCRTRDNLWRTDRKQAATPRKHRSDTCRHQVLK
jgi:hypothetical protein